MAFNGSGLFVRLYNWVVDRDAAVKIRADRMDAEMDGFATGLSTCVTKDGQTPTTARVPFAQGVGLGDGTVSAPAVNFTADTNTGIYRVGADEIGFAAGGTKMLGISSSGMSVTQTVTGTGTATVSPHRIDITENSAAGVAVTASVTQGTGMTLPTSAMGYQNVSAQSVNFIVGGSSGTGSRFASYDQIFVNSPSSALNTFRYYAANGAWAIVNSNDGGTPGSRQGYAYSHAATTWIGASATQWKSATGVEHNIGIAAGAGVDFKTCFHAIQLDVDAVSGSLFDVAYMASNNGGTSPGWNYLFASSNMAGSYPLKSTGTFIGTIGAQTFANFADASSATITGSLLKGPGINITGDGRYAFGGLTSAYPALTRVGTAVVLRLADNSGYTNIGASSFVGFSGASAGFTLFPQSDGVATLYNFGLTDFGRLQFGGTTSAFPAIKRVSTALVFRLADDSAYTNIGASQFVAESTGGGNVAIQAPSTASTFTLTLPTANDTLVGKATTDTLTNKTFDSAGTGNVLQIGGVTVSRGQIPGTATNDSASAGMIGEYLVASARGVSSTATMTIASPAVVTQAGHLNNGVVPVVFTTTGALPTGVVSGTTYYTLLGTTEGNPYSIATSVANALAGTAINTTGSQSGTHTCTNSVTLTSGVNIDVAGLLLTPGDWDVSLLLDILPANTTTVSSAASTSAAIGTTSATVATGLARYRIPPFTGNGTAVASAVVPPWRVSLAANTNYFAVLVPVFATSTMTFSGTVRFSARRVR